MTKQKKTLKETLLLNVDILDDLTMYLDEEPELHINDIIHLCNEHGWELVERVPNRVYGIYDAIDNKHVKFEINEENGYVVNYRNGGDSAFLTNIYKGRPFIRKQVKH